MPPVRALAAAATAVVALAAVPAAASAASLVYTDAAHDVWLSSADGAVKHRLTTDGATARYELPSQADDGTIVAVGEGTTIADGTKFAYFLRPDGTRIETQPLPAPSGIPRIPALSGAQVSPDGRMVAYDWASAGFNARVTYGSSLVGRVQSQDACAVWCAYSTAGPRWAPGDRLLVVGPYLDASGVSVQRTPGADPVHWFNLDDKGIASVDEAAGRLAIDGVDPATSSMNTLTIDEPASSLMMARYSGEPGSALPEATCVLERFTERTAFPRLSPDGTMLAWQDRAGVYVSPVPPQTDGSTCTLQPKLIAAGGSRPDWGVADVPAPAPGGPGIPGTPGTPGAPNGPGGGSPSGEPATGGKQRTIAPGLVLFTGNGAAGQAPKPALRLKARRLTLGTLRSAAGGKVGVTASVKLGRRTIALGKRTLALRAGVPQLLELKVPASAAKALRRKTKLSVAVAYKAGKKTHRKRYSVAVSAR